MQRTRGNQPDVSNDGAALRPCDVLVSQPCIDWDEVECEWPAGADEPLIPVVDKAVECELVFFPQLDFGLLYVFDDKAEASQVFSAGRLPIDRAPSLD